ncbi:phosphatidylglycerol lysyltransferase domain-containing protein [Thalassococcus sp. S3]|uniref:phosphatidylglycerol lysyltransferase domain-containing protein n=1 Tax=Thalassococcus sp. S3 TaxID=2017482 RepID=UPI0010242511|nr:phosphatidylglycerol lysyltransferase domain-containing protein [Thalassococcus sp. S3]QBF32101.1 hypothetical protein CFI11_12840 [Thalassococcus sp. S3]
MLLKTAPRLSQRHRLLAALRHGIPLSLAALCLWVVTQRLQHIDTDILRAGLQDISPTRWVLAAPLSAVSFWALGRYDAVAHRHLGTPVPAGAARPSGIVAIALSQSLGFGLLTGAFARWRMLPGLSLRAAFAVTAFVAVSFLLAWALVTATVIGITTLQLGWLACLAIATFFGACVTIFFHPRLQVFGRCIRLPTLPALSAILLWTAVDTLAAAGAFFLLMPGLPIGEFSAVLRAYLMALGASLLSGAPGGVGPFELSLLTALPQIDETSLMCSILGFRLIYYALPAAFAGLALLRPLRFAPRRHLPTSHPGLRKRAPRAEVGVILQTSGRILSYDEGAAAVLKTPQTETLLSDPVIGQTRAALMPLQAAARARNAVAALYKCSAHHAVEARDAGWSVIHISDEGILYPARFDETGPECRQLRRKLRQAARAGIRCSEAPDPKPWRAMSEVDQAWLMARGPALGTTMGRFDAAYLSAQRVFLAWHENNLVAFASFHQSDGEWCLDLMRASPQTPEGTMHALIRAAISVAKEENVPRLSLASVTTPRIGKLPLCAWLGLRQSPGLRRFKQSFAPSWRPLYLAAPNLAALLLAAADLARMVHRPTSSMARPFTGIHNEDEFYEFASTHPP